MGQKKDIKRQKEKLEAMKKEAEEERAKARIAARERVLLDFEKGQLFANPDVSTSTSGSDSQQGTFSHISHLIFGLLTISFQPEGLNENLHLILQLSKTSLKKLKKLLFAK